MPSKRADILLRLRECNAEQVYRTNLSRRPKCMETVIDVVAVEYRSVPLFPVTQSGTSNGTTKATKRGKVNYLAH